MLYQERQKLNRRKLELSRQWGALQQSRNIADTVSAAYRIARKIFPILDDGDPLETVKRVLREIQFQYSHKRRLQKSLKTEERRIKSWCFSKHGAVQLEDILSVEDYVRELLLRNDYPECKMLSGAPLLEMILDVRRKLECEEAELKYNISNQKAEQDAIPFQELAKQQEECYGRLNALESDTIKWKQQTQFWNNISKWVQSEADELDGAALQAHCEKISKDIGKITEYVASWQEYKKLIFKKNQLQQEHNNYQKMLGRLDELHELEFYSQEFIQQNIEQISRIFLSLHLPQEFSGLVMEGKELVGLRGGEKVPIVNMSTGQRTALALSVFFQMHLSNNAAPEFLLIDEPVANIDELNVLTLLDFLRELVISHGKQIFFTTASRNVAQLFRRKFSFLKDEFQRLDFLRKSTNDLEISQMTYNQEKAMLRKSIS